MIVHWRSDRVADSNANEVQGAFLIFRSHLENNRFLQLNANVSFVVLSVV